MLSRFYPNDPDYDPDGLSKPNEDYGFGCPRHRSVLVVLPTDQILRHCRASMATLSGLTREAPVEVMLAALKLAQVTTYDEVVGRVSELIRTDDEVCGHISLRQIHQVIDALADLHGNVMDFFHQLHKKPYRFVEPVRLVGADGLVLRVHS